MIKAYHAPTRSLRSRFTARSSDRPRAVSARPGFAAQSGPPQGDGHQIHLDQQALSGYGSRLLGLRAGAVLTRKASAGDDLSRWRRVYLRNEPLARADR